MNNLIKNVVLFPFNILFKINPAFELKCMFKLQTGYRLNLKNPKTYNEKLQWIKLYDKNPLMPKCCDKYLVREFIKNVGCEEILNELIWEGYDPQKIPFDSLPEKCVIKVTHGSSYNIISTDTSKLNRKDTIKKCRRWLKSKFLICYGEWFYGKEKPRVIVEKFIDSDDGEQLRDYKIFCFNGVPRYIRVDSDRFSDHKTDVFTTEWNRIKGEHLGFRCSNYEFEVPERLEDMLEYARKLSKPFLHARVDFYVSKGKIYFGEITFTNGAGFDKFASYDFDLEMGNWLVL